MHDTFLIRHVEAEVAVRLLAHLRQWHVHQFAAHMVEVAYPEFAAPELGVPVDAAQQFMQRNHALPMAGQNKYDADPVNYSIWIAILF